MDINELKAALELMQVQRFESSLAELNSTLVEILMKQNERDMTALVAPLTQALTAAFAAMPQMATPQVTVPVTVQPANVIIPPEPPEAEDSWKELNIDFKRNPNDGRFSGMIVKRMQ
jgi:thioesterase domain-containing protein